ncbi:unnamed protein product [Ambrosiozyma monospora]|uniref:Protein-lysine N-methyltransferase EFM4 n=1 Tax=Ambrosiozyma monospora TaxID=43982 RepID=A0A9W7DHP7_AMBMO|nr:unnamed protein product [Ambrosiozyma monospora]
MTTPAEAKEDTINLNHSKLGTKQYWDDFYTLETNNFKENKDDTGECWFDDCDAENRMVQFIMNNDGEQFDIENDKLLDLGTGNGHLLFELLEEGWNGPLVGIDYSEVSVRFAENIANTKDYKDVKFARSDILNDTDSFLVANEEQFDLVTDKGTLDAIGLSKEMYGAEGNLKGVDVYPTTVGKLVKTGGVLLITSCNFTEEELTRIILKNDKFTKWKTINYPTFQFGGVKGSAICSIAFMKK